MNGEDEEELSDLNDLGVNRAKVIQSSLPKVVFSLPFLVKKVLVTAEENVAGKLWMELSHIPNRAFPVSLSGVILCGVAKLPGALNSN